MADPNRSHNRPETRGSRIDPRRIERATELFTGLGKEGVPLPTSTIRKMLCAEFGVGKRQASVYLEVARKRLAEQHTAAMAAPEALLEQTDHMLLDAFNVAKQKSDAHAMVAASQRRAEVLGIFKREFKGTVEFTGLADLIALANEEERRSAEAERADSAKAPETVARRPR